MILGQIRSGLEDEIPAPSLGPAVRVSLEKNWRGKGMKASEKSKRETSTTGCARCLQQRDKR